MSTGTPFRGGPPISRRRSQRVILTLPVIVRTEGGPKESSFEEETQTLIVNLHGALILLAGKVSRAQMIHLKNRATREEQPCRVASLGPTSGSKTQIGVEFLKPSPDFWHISFPPEDWNLSEPSAIPAEQE
jgi:hypothetical protein